MRISTSKITGAVALSLIPVLGGISTASAGSTGEQVTSCPGDGYITRGDRCTKLDNGYLSIHLGSGGSYANVVYRKTAGDPITGKLGFLRGGVISYKASQTISTSVEASAIWSGLANPCYPTNGVLYTSGTTYTTPAATYSTC
ncbi:hypothetical protein R6L23_01335 [Streptomyces sp. SR27]|uniref:hypothetical protein n=1 Tax=Streptomyces sp. SR27 TaxID=3076630 RepID=UPI00295B7753|nr:hypothetical protein [Streptomyces sp. SR27]MDV9186882.1 hypothetical protein [Streptomyces sp. SR27]